MTFHDGGFKHTAQKAEHISKGSVFALTLVAGRSNGCFFMVQQPCPGSLSPGLLANACTITYLTRWKERGTIRFIPELVHNLASALALRAPLVIKIALGLNIHTVQCFIAKCVDSTSFHLAFLSASLVVRTISSSRARGSDHDQSSVRVQKTATISACQAAPPAHQEPALEQRWFKVLQSAWQRDRAGQSERCVGHGAVLAHVKQ